MARLRFLPLYPWVVQGWLLVACVHLMAPSPLNAAAVAPQAGRDFRIADGDLADLEVTVRAPRGADGRGLLELEVRNGSRSRVEPLRFELALRPAKKNSKLIRQHVIQRVPSPLAGRGGRSVRAGGKETWLVPAPFTGDERVKWEARVAAASFFDGRGFERCPATLSEVANARATLRNECDQPVRIILQANPSEQHPRLFAEDLAPGESREVGADQRPALHIELPSEFPPLFGPVEKLEIVDWSVLCDPGETEARTRMRDAHEARYRWPSPPPEVTGTVRYELEGDAWSLPRKARGRATFTFTPGHAARVESSKSLSDSERHLLGSSLAQAFGPMLQPAFETWAGEQVFQRDQMDEGQWVFLPRAEEGQDGVHDLFRHVDLRAGLPRRRRTAGLKSYLEERMLYVAAPDGRALVAETRTQQVSFGRTYPQALHRFVYDREGTLPWVRQYLHERYAGEGVVHGRVSLELSDISFARSADPTAPPSGEGAAALRVAWESGYRYPPNMTVEAKFTVETRDRPHDWLRNRRTRGQLRFEAWRGGVPAYDRGEVHVEGHDADDAAQLASLFRARQSIWCRQDPAGRRDFDEVFAGAIIQPRKNQPGTFDLEHPTLLAVRVRDGLVVGLDFQDGRSRRWSWAERHGSMVPLRLEQQFGDWSSTVTLKWQTLGDEMNALFPSRVEIEDWFGDGWGPEVYEFEFGR